ncbi:MAG: hypothetical protein QF792_05205, partial [Phycisphaerae bacterium]|nr:hypothetical protein [Phycisphaerae bacterium]
TTRMLIAAVLVCLAGSVVSGKSLKAPPGLFKDLNDEIVADAIIINGKQLFIDDYIIDELKGAEKVLNQPVKHPKNPIITGYNDGRSSVIYDEAGKTYKMWYGVRGSKAKTGLLCYATSKDGIAWEKPIVNQQQKSNSIFLPKVDDFCAYGVFKDPAEKDLQKQYKMLFSAKTDGTVKTWSVNAAYSPDGIHWTAEPKNPVAPFSDTQICSYWDARLGKYVAYLRYGPPNVRLISRIESEDFVHWSPKVTVIGRTKMDQPFATCFYGMRIMPYEGIYLGFITAYHGETIYPIPQNKLWMDRKNVQLAFSRNGLTWSRVGRHGAIPHGELSKRRDWKKIVREAVFIPYGRHGKDWDWGVIYTSQPPLVVGDEIRIYYQGHDARNWWTHSGDPPKLDPNAREPNMGIGLATLRLDGFVSVDAKTQGTMTTKKFLFIGDTLEVNANAKGGSIVVEALDANGKVIKGFSKTDCIPITTDNIRHVLKWKGQKDCHLIQARPIRLRF